MTDKSLLSDQPAAPQPKPITDLSTRAVSLGRIADRLQPGIYHLTLVKGEKGSAWQLVVPQAGIEKQLK